MLFFVDWTSWNFLFATIEITTMEKKEVIEDVQILYQGRKQTKGEIMSVKYTEGQVQDKMKRILWQWYWRHMQWRIQRIFRQTGTYIEPTNAAPWFSQRGEIFKICASRYSKNAFPGRLFLDFFVKHFPNYLSISFHYKKLFRGWFLKNSYFQITKFVWL